MLQRAALAAFCFQRAHMRDFAVLVAKRCSAAALHASRGLIGALLIEGTQVLPEPVSYGRRKRTRSRGA